MKKCYGLCEIIVVDDGSSDYTYEIAWATIKLDRRRYPRFVEKLLGNWYYAKRCWSISLLQCILSISKQ